MARSKNPGKRKNRIWTEISGTTLSTLPSGVTIDSSGLITAAGTVSPTELSYLDGAGGDVLACDKGTGFSITGASVPWAGTTLQIDHGFTTLQSINVIYSGACNATRTGASPAVCHIVQDITGDANSTVSAVVVQVGHGRIVASGDSTVLMETGGTIFWMAFGK